MTAMQATASRSRLGGTGLALAVLSAATFGTSGTFASSLIGAGWSPVAAVLARVSLAALLLTIPAISSLRGQWGTLRRSAGRIAAFGLFAVAGAQLCFFNAIERMPVGIAILLEYLGTILVVLWLWLRRGQRPRPLTIGGGIAAMAGLAMVLDLTGSVSISPIGVMWALLAAVGLATYFVISADEGTEPVPPVAMAWGGMCVGAALLAVLGLTGALPLAASTGNVTFAGHRMSWIVPVLGLALVAAAIPYIAGIGAARRLGAKLASFIGLAEVLFAIGFAWLLLGQLPTIMQLFGGVAIVAGVTLVRIDELKGQGASDELFSGAPVEPLPDEVGVAVVPGVLLDHVPQDISQGESLAVVCSDSPERLSSVHELA